MSVNMKVSWKPAEGSPREWVIDLQNPSWDIRSQTERLTDWPWGAFRERLGNESGLALQALLYVLRKRDEPRLEIGSVIPNMDELDFTVQCSRCKAWVDDEDHTCPEPEFDDEPKKSGKKKAGEPDPEA